MIKNTPYDRYNRYTYNPVTNKQEREWIKYADGTYEPVRRTGSLSKKWNDQRTDFAWWTERKPADWMPQDEGLPFAWNHTLGEDNKPHDWADKSPQETEEGNTPYFMLLNINKEGCITDRTENIDGRREHWEFAYDEDGRLSGCLGDTGWSQEFEYDTKGRRSRDYAVGRTLLMREFVYSEDDRLLSAGDTTYEHNVNGFRTAKTDKGGTTHYDYSPDYRLLGATLPSGDTITYAHGQAGNRRIKYINGKKDEEYLWLDFIRLSAFDDTVNRWIFHYDNLSRVPLRATINDRDYTLHTTTSAPSKRLKTIQETW